MIKATMKRKLIQDVLESHKRQKLNTEPTVPEHVAAFLASSSQLDHDAYQRLAELCTGYPDAFELVVKDWKGDKTGLMEEVCDLNDDQACRRCLETLCRYNPTLETKSLEIKSGMLENLLKRHRFDCVALLVSKFATTKALRSAMRRCEPWQLLQVQDESVLRPIVSRLRMCDLFHGMGSCETHVGTFCHPIPWERCANNLLFVKTLVRMGMLKSLQIESFLQHSHGESRRLVLDAVKVSDMPSVLFLLNGEELYEMLQACRVSTIKSAGFMSKVVTDPRAMQMVVDKGAKASDFGAHALLCAIRSECCVPHLDELKVDWAQTKPYASHMDHYRFLRARGMDASGLVWRSGVTLEEAKFLDEWGLAASKALTKFALAQEDEELLLWCYEKIGQERSSDEFLAWLTD